jgi:four helix bundle protein
MAMSSYRELLVWKNGMELVRRVYGVTRCFPKEETFGLSSQLQRAAVSIPANLAEGHTRDTTREYLRYVVIAHGSLAELETLLAVASDLGYVDRETVPELAQLCDQTGRMLGALRRKLKAKAGTRWKPQIPKSLNP